ncbi:type II toxin-antitoxin system RnlA family toxin [Pseudanabaenaceae cyanobacterium LEGE 13415]|nr:type II toxin-antitoxin system RnlA family toxin [Pseudanabaenaceae cyanobacterium LEGE 13415]
MSSDFKELNLDRTRLKDCIEEFWKDNNLQGGEYSEESDKSHRVKYSQDNCQVMVDFLFLKNGTTTIKTKTGKHPDKGEQLAAYLKNKLVGDSRKSISVSIKDIQQDDFDLLVEFLQELTNEDSEVPAVSVVVSSDDAVKKTIKATTQYKDSLTLTHYRTTNTLLIQGKPLHGYYQVSYFLSEFTSLNGFLAIVYKGEEAPTTVDINERDIEIELQALLPNAYSNLGEGILKMLRTSCTLKNTSISLPEYSCYVFPALRALEGVMRRLLFERGYSLEYENDNSFGGLFYRDAGGKYIAKSDFRGKIGDSKICDALGYCYTYFVVQRHTLFHANDFTDSSTFVATKDEATQTIEKIIKTIDTAYKMVK